MISRIIKKQIEGVCCKAITLTLREDNLIEDIDFEGGCSGWTQAIKNLAKNKNLNEIIPLFKGVRCGRRETSCPDQLAKMWEELHYGEQ